MSLFFKFLCTCGQLEWLTWFFFGFFYTGRVRLWDVRAGPRETAAALGGHRGGVHAVSCESPKFVFTGDGDGVVRAWDWRRAGGGPIASANAHEGVVTAVTPLRFDRADVAASAGVDGVVRVLSLDGGKGGGVALVGHLAPVTGLVRLGGFVGEGGAVSLFLIFVWAI